MNNQLPTPSKTFKTMWVKIVLIIILLIVTNHYFQPGFYLGIQVNDRDNILASYTINKSITQKYLGPYNSTSYSHKDFTWEIIQPAPGHRWYLNLIYPSGKKVNRILEYDTFYLQPINMYFNEPFLFVSSFPGYLHTINTETLKVTTFDARSYLCRGDGTYLSGVVYENGVLYTQQFKEWSRCSGYYKQRLNLE